MRNNSPVMTGAGTRQRGMTLVELLVSVAIISVVVLLAGSLLVMGAKGYRRNITQTALQQDARLKADFITGHVRNAKAVSAAAPAQDHYLLIQVDSSGTQQHLVLDTVTPLGTKRRVVGSPLQALKFYNTHDSRLLGVTLTVQKQTQSFTLDFTVLMENTVVGSLGSKGSSRLYMTTYD